MTTTLLDDLEEDQEFLAPAHPDDAELTGQDLPGADGEGEAEGEIAGDLAAARARANRLLAREIEFMYSPAFDAPNAEQEILGPYPDGSGERERGEETATAPPDTPPYLAALYRFPLLTKEQEQYLFRKMNYLKYRAHQLRRQVDPEFPQPELLEEIEGHLADALTVRNHIVRANLRLVVSIAKSLVDSANEFDDIVSQGNLPLIRAAEIFDFERGTRFSTYATWAVRNSLYRATPRNRRRQKRFPTGSDAVFESLADYRATRRTQESYHRDLRMEIERVLSGLDDRDRTILVSRFGLNGNDRPQRFREIAEKLEISTERVRQLLGRSLEQLGELMDEEPGEGATASR